MLYLDAVRVDIVDLESSLPIVTEGGQKVLKVSNTILQSLSDTIIKELKILNLHLLSITNEDIREEDIK